MRRWCALGFVAFWLALASLGCSAEDKRQWHEAMSEWNGDNIRFGSHKNSQP